MYKYDEQNKLYEFDGNFEDYLISIGVDKNHIKNMRNKIMQDSRGEYHDYPDLNSPECRYIDLVPLNKVIGTSRSTVGQNVYDNITKIPKGSRSPAKFIGCFEYFTEMSFEELKQSYSELYEPVDMVYYVDEDAYYLSNNGNHRTLTAMMVGAEYIKAKVTNAYLNPVKRRKCEYAEAFIKKYSIYRILEFGGTCDITFQDENGYYELCGYRAPEENEDTFSFINRLSETFDYEMQRTAKLMKLPSFIRNIILERGENYRLKCLLNKKYFSESDLPLLHYRQHVYLENL